MYIPVSPNPYDSISEEEAFSKVFNHNMGHIDIKEEINPENVCFIKGNKKQITQNAISFEDFDQFYKKFTDIEEVDEIEVENYERPSFYINFSQEKIHEVGYSMKNAVELAKNLANSNQIVLLSPACASFDMYDGFESRGKDFKNIVNSL